MPGDIRTSSQEQQGSPIYFPDSPGVWALLSCIWGMNSFS